MTLTALFRSVNCDFMFEIRPVRSDTACDTVRRSFDTWSIRELKPTTGVTTLASWSRRFC